VRLCRSRLCWAKRNSCDKSIQNSIEYD
jgi:hypothetical protein